MARGAWWATVLGVAKSGTWLLNSSKQKQEVTFIMEGSFVTGKWETDWLAQAETKKITQL